MMKLKLSLVFTSALFLFSITSLQAGTEIPDILSSVSPGSVQILTKAESSETRGEFRYCSSSTGYCTPWQFTASSNPPPPANYPWRLQVYSYGYFYVSR